MNGQQQQQMLPGPTQAPQQQVPPSPAAIMGVSFPDMAVKVDRLAQRVPWFVWLGIGAGLAWYLAKQKKARRNPAKAG